jgi:hypothetical protein
LLSALVFTIREVFQYFMVLALRIQIAGASINETLLEISNTAIANNRVRIIYADCFDKFGDSLTECVSDPVKREQAEQLANGMGSLLNGNAVEAMLGAISPDNVSAGATPFLASAITTVLATPFIAFCQIILTIWQYIFINMVEATAALTAIAAPVFLSYSLFTRSAPLFAFWVITFSSLFFMQLAYIVLIGFNAAVVSMLDGAGVPVGSIVSDLAFLAFLALGAPFIAHQIAKGGGEHLYQQFQSNALTLGRFTIALFK